MKKTLVCIIFLISISIILYGIFECVSQSKLSAYDYLLRHAIDSEKPEKLLYYTNDDNTYIIFYIAEKKLVKCAILYKNWISYDIISYSGNLNLTYKDSYLWSRYEDGTENGGGIAWGLIQNPEITEVYIGDMKCQQAQADGQNFRIFWVLADEKEMHEDFSLSNPGKMKSYTALYD